MPQIIEVAGETFEYYSRAEWGSRQTDRPFESDGPEPKFYYHHEGGGYVSPSLTVEQEKQKMRDLQAYCIDRAPEPWSDIPYNVCVFPSGRVYEGRGWEAQSAATANENTESKAVLILGNYSTGKAQPTAISLNNAALICRWGVDRRDLVPTPQVLGHWENPDHFKATNCPGENIDMNKVRALVTHKLAWRPPTPTPEPPEEEMAKPNLVLSNHPHYNVNAVFEKVGNHCIRVEPGPYGRYVSDGLAPAEPKDLPFEDWTTLAVDFTFVLSPQ